MADSTISGLSSAATITGTEVLPVDQSGSTKKVTVANLTPGLDEFVGDVGSPSVAGTKGLVPAPSPGDASKFLRADGTWATPAAGSGSADGSICCGRLTLESGVPVSTTDQTAKTTIYWTPYNGAAMDLYDGADWQRLTNIAETSLALGTLTSGKNYDVFGYNNSGTFALELSAAWTNDTTRANALALQDGIYCKSGTLTRRYLGTFRTTSTTTTEDSGGGVTTQVGGKRFLWNAYNRARRHLKVFDDANSWTYSNTTTWRQAGGIAGNKVEFVIGLAGDSVDASLVAVLTAGSTGAGSSQSGIGYDSTTAVGGSVGATYGGSLNTNAAYRSECPAIGYHYFSWLERATQSGTTTWQGDGNGGFQSALSATAFG